MTKFYSICGLECTAPTLSYGQSMGSCNILIASSSKCDLACIEHYTGTGDTTLSCNDGVVTGSGPVCKRGICACIGGHHKTSFNNNKKKTNMFTVFNHNLSFILDCNIALKYGQTLGTCNATIVHGVSCNLGCAV